MTINRRSFLRIGVGAAVTAGGAGRFGLGSLAAKAATRSLPNPADSGIDHIVVVMMENRSFDHYFGWVPGADGKQAGLIYIDRYGHPQTTRHLAPDFRGCASPDPDHSFEGGRIQLNGGKCDGWLISGENDPFAIGYYQAPDLSFYGQAVPQWTTFDRYFAATMAETYPNRFYQHSAQTDRTHNSMTTATMPTIWDRLAAARIKGTYYYTDVPFLALYGSKYISISQPVEKFTADCAAGTLPAVSYVDPKFLDAGSGTSADDHPHADIRAGQAFLNGIYRSVTTSPAWNRTALVINYDEWGGFYDHVAPAVAPDARPDLGTGLRGFRVPCTLISPLARRGYVDHNTYDHTSILKMIEWRFGLDPLTPRDSAANNLAMALDFKRPPNLSAASYSVPSFVGLFRNPTPISNYRGAVSGYEEWQALNALATTTGYSVGI